jgi:hypothetical protein
MFNRSIDPDNPGKRSLKNVGRVNHGECLAIHAARSDIATRWLAFSGG